MRSLDRSDPTRCAHGSALEVARIDCPRCADRLVLAPDPRSRFPRTRWHATDTTLGPRWKVAITAALVLPLLLMILQIRNATHDPSYAFLMVPIGGLGLFTAQFLPYLWEPGRQRTPNRARSSESP